MIKLEERIIEVDTECMLKMDFILHHIFLTIIYGDFKLYFYDHKHS